MPQHAIFLRVGEGHVERNGQQEKSLMTQLFSWRHCLLWSGNSLRESQTTSWMRARIEIFKYLW